VSDGEPRYYRSTDGLDLAYRHYGRDADGLPVVCLPGITRNSRDFEDLAATLAARRPVICPDFRGRGFSAHDPEWRNYRPPTYVRDVLTLLDTLDVARAAFIGTSLGGLVSMLLADASRDRVAGIVLNDIGPVIGPEGLERIKGYIGRAAPVATWDEAVSQAKEIYEIAWPGLSAADWQRIVRRAYREDASGRPVLDMDPMVGDAARTVGTGIEDPWALFRGLAGLPLRLPEIHPDASSCHHLAVLELGEREAVRRGLAEKGVASGVHYPIPCHLQPACAAFPTPPLPAVERAADRLLSLPLFPGMDEAEIGHVLGAMRALLEPSLRHLETAPAAAC